MQYFRRQTVYCNEYCVIVLVLKASCHHASEEDCLCSSKPYCDVYYAKTVTSRKIFERKQT